MSKRIFTSAGVIQRLHGTRSSGAASVTAASSSSSRSAAARLATSPSPSVVSTAPPGKTHAPPMNREAGLRLMSRTSSFSAPPRSSRTVAAGLGLVTSPVFSSSPGPGASTSVIAV